MLAPEHDAASRAQLSTVKETEVSALVSLLRNCFPMSVCKIRQKALWAEQAAIYSIPQNIYSAVTPTRPSHHVLDSTQWECTC